MNSVLNKKTSNQVDFDVGLNTKHKHSPPPRKNEPKRLIYKKASNIGTGKKNGWLVFTGQPGPNKHMEFIFYDEDGKHATRVPEPVIRGFLHIYQKQDKDKGVTHWEFMKNPGKGLNTLPGIPVFYLRENGQISSLGLSQMYKLAYKNSIGETIEHTSREHLANNAPDLAELIFGMVDENDGKQGLKGRVSFSHAVCEQDNVKTARHRTILNSPKPTYYPNYVRQNEENGRLVNKEQDNGKPQYQTYMEPAAEIRGWKRYPVRPDNLVQVQQLSHEQRNNEKITVQLEPLTGKVTFHGRVRFHNLRRFELGALVWALEWGGRKECKHAIGMGKPFGFGQISIEIDAGMSRSIPNKPTGEEPALQACREAFKESMDAWYREQQREKEGTQSWEESEQIAQLLAMTDPGQAPGKPGHLAHLDLAGGGRNNQFVQAKNKLLVLEDYVAYQGADRQNSQDGGPRVLPNPTGPETKEPSSSRSPAEAWLENSMQELAGKFHEQPEKMLYTKALAEHWNKLEDADLKATVLMIIRTRWTQRDLWDSPQGRSTKKARAIYGADE